MTSVWGVLDWGGVIKLWRMGHPGKRGLSQIPSPSGGKIWPWFFCFIRCVHSGRICALREKSRGIWTRRLATSPAFLGKAAFNFGYYNFFFFIVPNFEQKCCEREVVWNLFICETQGWDGEVREEFQCRIGGKESAGRETILVSALNAYPKNHLRLEAPSRGHLICFPTFRDRISFCFL